MRPAPIQTTNRYVVDLHNNLYNFFAEVRDVDFLLEQDEFGYEKLSRDAFIAGIIRQAKLLTVGQHHSFSPGPDENKMAAAIIERLHDEMQEDDLQKSLFNLMDSMLTGLSIGKVILKKKWFVMQGDVQARWWWVLDKVIDINKQRVKRMREVDAQGNTLWKWSIFDLETRKWVMLDNPEDYVWHFYDTPESHPNGKGLGGSLFYYWHAKAVMYEMLLQGAETWSGGWVVAMIDGLKRNTTNAFADRATTQDWLDTLEKMKSYSTLVMSKDDDVRIESGPSGGLSWITESLRYLDESISMLLLSGNLPMINQGGSYALADVKQEEQQAGPIQYNRISLAGAWSKHVVRNNLWRRNLPNIRAMGLGDASPPKFVLSNQKVYDPQEEMNIISAMRSQGMEIKLDEAYERTGYSMVDDQDRAMGNVLGPPAAPAPMMGGFGFSKTATLNDQQELSEVTPSPWQDAITDAWKAVASQLSGGGPIPGETWNKLFELTQKTQAFADIEGREQMAKELAEKGIPKKEQEEVIDE